MFSSAMRWPEKRLFRSNLGGISLRVLLGVATFSFVLWGVIAAISAGSNKPDPQIVAPTTASRVPPTSTSLDLQPSEPGVAVVGSKAPEFSVPNLRPGQGIGISISSTAPTLLNFWASWCIPCREEFPELRRLRNRYSSSELAMVGITFKDTRSEALRFANSEGANWELGFDRDGTVARKYGVRAAPQTLLIDKAGLIIRRWYGRPSTSDLNLAVENLVSGN